MTGLRILIADDHDVVRHGLVALIESQRGWEVCGQAENGQVAVDKAKELNPDVAILDIGMPVLNGLEATRQILRDNPRVAVLILTIMDAERVVQAARDVGARGYLLKSEAARVMIGAVKALQYGNTLFTARVAELFQSGYLENERDAKKRKTIVPTFGVREQAVLQLVAKGQSNRKVAEALGMSPRTVDSHRTNIMRKLGAHSVVGIILYALRNGIMPPTFEKSS
ncbi:MAG: response regulator transcription factor [Terriglobales bacterium]|jgi:DNA-binding NarL/FixJ family response regulator